MAERCASSHRLFDPGSGLICNRPEGHDGDQDHFDAQEDLWWRHGWQYPADLIGRDDFEVIPVTEVDTDRPES